MAGPLLEQLGVVAFHQLKAAVEVFFDPTIEVAHSFGHHPALFPEAAIDGLGIAVLEALDHHVEHADISLPRTLSSRTTN
jgi:hypothetical protein